MPYYDTVFKKWHDITGRKGGAFKELILNDALLSALPDIAGKTLLEIGCGNGYLLPMVLKRLSGQVPERIIRTDVSPRQLDIAQRHFHIENCEHLLLDVYRPFPVGIQTADIILSSMVYNEVSDKGLKNGISESARILAPGGVVVTAVLHPLFVQKQLQRGVVRRSGKILLMPGSDGLELPVVERSVERYREIFGANNLTFETSEIFGNEKLWRAKPKLRELKETPVALLVTSQLQVIGSH